MRKSPCLRDERVTFGDGQKANQNKRMLVGTSNVVVDVPNRKVDRVVFLLAGRNRHGRFVAAQDDRNEG